ncbi:MAG: choice-of-anchor B family protein [bacterium]
MLTLNGFAQTLRFEDVTPRAGVAVPTDPNGYGHGVAVADYNGDGLPDIYVVSYDANNSLFLNNGDGSFTDRAAEAGVLTGSRYDRGIAAADYDNDGDVDFYIASGAGSNNLLYANDARGAFREVSGSAGVRVTNFQGQGVSWGDYDNDGDLDLFLPSFDDPARLFRQEADHSFTEVTEQAGIIHSDQSVQSVFFDFDLDGDLDIMVSRGEGSANRFFVNQADGTFADEALERNIADPDAHGQGLAVADYDGDGDLDIYMSNANGGNRLYRNDGGQFAEVAEAAGVRDGSRSLGCMCADFDNDGWPDLYVGNFGRNRIFRNNGDGSFTDETEGSGADDPNRAYGTSTIDYDTDGRLDIFFSNSGQTSNLLQNRGPRRHWLNINLSGKKSNRNGIGARVTVSSGNRRQVQQLIAGSAMVSGGNDLSFHFGLGANTRAEHIEVEWPSGERDVLSNVAANRTIDILEGSYGAALHDTTAPLLSDILVEFAGNGNAIISWASSEPATAQVEYGLTAGYGSHSPPLAELRSYHTVRIAGLMGGELYHFRVRSLDAAGNVALSENMTFTTERVVLPYVIRAVAIGNISGHGAEITWRTYNNTNCTVEYGTTTVYGLQAQASSSEGLNHSVALDGLAPNTTYHFQIIARHNQNQIVRSPDYSVTTLFELDTAPPQIWNVDVRNVSTSRATIVWETDENATSRVEYGTNTNYGETAQNNTLVTYHEIELSGLASNTTYHYRVLSRDAAGNQAASEDFSFTTERSGGGGGGTVTDDFNRSDVGSGWTLDGRYWEINNGELGHSSAATGSWRYLAVFNRISSGNGRRITEVSYRWGQNVDEIGVREGAMALMLDRDSPHANGYWIWHRYNQVWLWTIVNGEYVGGIDLGHFSGSSDPVAGDVVSVVIREESDANYFDYYINGRYSATAYDSEKHFPRSNTWYTGVFMRGEGVRNECDDFSVSYVQEDPNQPPLITDIQVTEISSAAATISWKTNVPTTAKLEYCLSGISDWLAAADLATATSHVAGLSGLLPNRSYRYRIVARNASGASATSGEQQFVTKPNNGDLANNVELLGFLPLSGVPTLGNVWGYADANGEYALVCLRQNGLAIVDATDPRRPQRVASVTSFYSDLKEVKVYQHYAIAVNEFGPIQIVDLANPRQPELVARYEESFSGAHNLFIAGHYAYVVGTHPADRSQDEPTGLHIIDLADPTQPRLAGKREGFYIHDLYVENDTAYVLGYRTHRVHLWDVRDKNDIRELASFPYRAPHTVRRGFDKKILLLNDEGRGQDVQFWDLGDLNNIRKVGSYMTDPLIAPHNIETIGPLAFIAYFEDMLRIVDYGDPSSPVEVGFYDTYPENPSHDQPLGAHQTAAWGVYPHAPSGNIYLSDMKKGLYIFRHVPPGPATSERRPERGENATPEGAHSRDQDTRGENAETLTLPQQFALSNYPNPFYAGQATRIRLHMPTAGQIHLTVFDILGRTVKEIATGDYAGGIHEVHWRGENQEGRKVAQGVYILRLQYHSVTEESGGQLLQRILVLP